MINEVIYGQKPINPNTSYIELTLNGKKLQVDICNEGTHDIWHLIMKDVSRYDALKEQFIKEANELSDDIGYFIDVVQGQDIHDRFKLEYDVPANDTAVLVSMKEIDDYIEETENRLMVNYEKEGIDTSLPDMTIEEIESYCEKNNIDFENPLNDFSEDYWCGVLATLRWITMGSEKHDSDVLG